MIFATSREELLPRKRHPGPSQPRALLKQLMSYLIGTYPFSTHGGAGTRFIPPCINPDYVTIAFPSILFVGPLISVRSRGLPMSFGHKPVSRAAEMITERRL